MKRLFFLCLGFFIIVADLLTKIWAVSSDEIVSTINYGISWGIGSYGWRSGVVFAVLSLCIVFLCWSYARVRLLAHKNITAEILIMSGALGNIMSRMIYQGGVVDFIDISYLIGYSFPLFNIADVAIFFGVILLFIREFFYES